VIGKDVSYVLLQAIAELSEDGLRQRLADLQAAEFLYETSLFPELEYTFKHALTHEVAYGSLLQDRRRALHARIVAAMEDLYPGRLTEHVERLGHHALRGEVWDKAVGYLREAGAKAAGRSAHRDAVACFEQALAALGHVPESRETREQTIDLRLELRISLQALGEFEQLVEHLREAEALADDLDDRRRLGRVSVYRARYSWYACDFASAVELGQRALSAAGALPDLALQILANNFLGDVYTSLADYDRAQDLFERNLAVLHGDLLRERFGGAMLASVFCSRGLAFCRAERGEFLEAAAHGAEAVHRAEAGDDAQGIIEACTALGHVYLAQGEPSRAIPIFERGLELCQTWNTAVRFPAIASHLGYAYALVGRVAEGLPLLEEAIGQAAARPALVDQSQRLVWLSEAYHLADRAGEAAPLAGRALQLAREHQERGHESRALWLLGEIAAHAEPPDITEAEGHYREALALAEELGMRPLVAHCHLGLGTLHHKIGRWEQARAELEMAVDMYRAMDMTFWLARAEAALTSTG